MDNEASCYRRFLEGDRGAIVDIVSRYNDGLVLFLNSFIGDFPLAEEVAEDVFCELLSSRPAFDGKSTFKTWLYAIGRYKAIRILKRRRRAVPVDALYLQTDEADIERSHIRNEDKIQLHRALGRIKPDYSQVLYLTFFEGFTNAEAAQIMNKSGKQIENLIYRAKKSLKKELEREGFEYEEL